MKESNKQEELNYLVKRIFIFYDFFSELYGGSKIYKDMKVIIQKEYENKNLRGLRATSNDFTNQLRDLPFKDAIDLQAILKKELGEDLAIIEKKRLTNIQKIIKKGKIITDEEYYLVRERTEEIYNDVNHRNELEKLNALIIEFDESKSKR